jgi:hypothetical protein
MFDVGVAVVAGGGEAVEAVGKMRVGLADAVDVGEGIGIGVGVTGGVQPSNNFTD